MGNIKDLVSMIPGVGAVKDMDIDNNAFKSIKQLFSHDTGRTANPDLINGNRKKNCSR